MDHQDRDLDPGEGAARMEDSGWRADMHTEEGPEEGNQQVSWKPLVP